MKKLAYSIIVMFLFVGLTDLIAKNNVEKRKTIQKSYTVKEFVKLSIDNSFGRVHINTTNSNKIDVKIEIIAKRKTEERALELLKLINVNIEETGSMISFETDINGSLNNKNTESFEINYTVSMPMKNPLYVKNSFGDTYLSDLDGDAELKIAYGDVKTETLNGTSKIKLSFGDGHFKYVKTGEVEVKYSDATFDKMGIVKFEQGFSDVEIGIAQTLDMTSKYGDLEIGKIDGIRGYIGYSDLSIGYLTVEADLEASYAGGFEIDQIAKGFKSVKMEGKFSSFELEFESGTNGTFEARVKYGDFDYSDDQIELNYRNKSDNKAEYRGTIGNGQGGHVEIITSYGNIELD
ncbi:hypothetical protein [Reichenbachiella ulvae]|uniref:Adhesin n=1 Tax=Reichenbachiella ulvae TaxID=2980104 RepID=A0ABT3CUL2_9BACT|nr:hypothetical protein [Reichenbachiella ulvae]MCV9386923.1 hypothetical protein [Reichenbachiella ulvae]